jgi:surfeit locus 1 family protein
MSMRTGPESGAPPRRSWLGLLTPAVIAFALLVGLGIWQIQRKAWKEGLIATLTERLAAPPAVLPAPATWPDLDQATDEYRRVKFSAVLDNAKEALVYGAASAFRPDVSGPGYWVFTPARLADGRVLIINRGFVPEGRQDPKSRLDGQTAGMIEFVGIMRWPDPRHWFTPNDEPKKNLWFSRDPQSIAAAKSLTDVAPFYIEQESPAPPGGLPQPGELVVKLPDNHLQYALTWFGLAIVLVVVFVVWAFGSRHRTGNDGQSPRPRDPSHSL